MNLDELYTVQSKERQRDSLQNLRPSFYQEVGEYIADLEAERERAAEAAADPFSSPEVGRLTDEIETARDVVEAIYERRMGKLVKQASLTAAGMSADEDGLTAEERDLFEDLVSRIEANKGRVLDTVEGEEQPERRTEKSMATDRSVSANARTADDPAVSSEGTPVPPDEPLDPDDGTPPSREEGITAADVMGESAGDGGIAGDAETASDGIVGDAETASDGGAVTETESDDDGEGERSNEAEAGAADVDRVTVRITRDVGSILGIDEREYTLSNDDVVTLPKQNAAPLLEREAAEPLE